MRLTVTLALAALVAGCATMEANMRAAQFADHCYAERGYPDLMTADGCTERDIFNGQQRAQNQAENQAKLQESLAQLQELAAEQRQQQEAIALSTPPIQLRPYVPLPPVQLVPPPTPLTNPFPHPTQCFTTGTDNQLTTTCYP